MNTTIYGGILLFWVQLRLSVFVHVYYMFNTVLCFCASYPSVEYAVVAVTVKYHLYIFSFHIP